MLFSHYGCEFMGEVLMVEQVHRTGNDANVLKSSKELVGLTEGCFAAIDD